MKQYRLLKDLPGLKKGAILSEGKSLFGARTLITKNDVGPIFIGNDLTEEIFEEVEPTDSIHWKPKIGEKYFYIDEYGNVEREIWDNDGVDNEIMAMGFVRLTSEEATEARDRRLAEVRLRQTSDFEPDFAKGKGGWVVCYDYLNKKIDCFDSIWNDSGEPVRYATKEDAKKSIRENREDWLTYFGIKEEE